MCQAFGTAAMPVDTHIHRLAQRWGLTDGRSVEQTEADLKALFPEHLWKELHLQVDACKRGGEGCSHAATLPGRWSAAAAHTCPPAARCSLQVIFFGRERCPAQRHDPLQCPICSWAAVPPYDKAGNSPQKAGGAKSPRPAKKRGTAASPAAAKRTRRSVSQE